VTPDDLPCSSSNHNHHKQQQTPCHHRPRLAARYDDPYGAVIDYSAEVEDRILRTVGKEIQR
jgi:hypothetical protein